MGSVRSRIDLLFCIRKDTTMIILLEGLGYSIKPMYGKVNISKKIVYLKLWIVDYFIKLENWHTWIHPEETNRAISDNSEIHARNRGPETRDYS
jgi:hypothetical protein